jgi:hypothetical protein
MAETDEVLTADGIRAICDKLIQRVGATAKK